MSLLNLLAIYRLTFERGYFMQMLEPGNVLYATFTEIYSCTRPILIMFHSFENRLYHLLVI